MENPYRERQLDEYQKSEVIRMAWQLYAANHQREYGELSVSKPSIPDDFAMTLARAKAFWDFCHEEL